MSNPPRDSRTSSIPGEKGILHSTTEGRQRFPDILQTSFGEKTVIGFDRYGRALGAVVPMEAVRVLAGCADSVDEDVQSRIRRSAQSLLRLLPSEAMLCGLDAQQGPVKLVEIEDLDKLRSGSVKKLRRPAR